MCDSLSFDHQQQQSQFCVSDHLSFIHLLKYKIKKKQTLPALQMTNKTPHVKTIPLINFIISMVGSCSEYARCNCSTFIHIKTALRNRLSQVSHIQAQPNFLIFNTNTLYRNQPTYLGILFTQATVSIQTLVLYYHKTMYTSVYLSIIMVYAFNVIVLPKEFNVQ